tara:strand:- start:22072 stop:23574 length:1503 start_codon:yes stop_codon:yes gene_type:complete
MLGFNKILADLGTDTILLADLGLHPLWEDLEDERIETSSGCLSVLHRSGRHCDTSRALEIISQEFAGFPNLFDLSCPPMDCPVFGEFAFMLIAPSSLQRESKQELAKSRSALPKSKDPVVTEQFMQESKLEPQKESDFVAPAVIDPLAWGDVEPPARRWVVEGWIPSGHVTGLYGPPGNGKSLLAQTLLTACAVGRPWLGMNTTPMKVFGLFCEDETEELWRRQWSINKHYDCTNYDLENMLLTSLHGLPSMLMDFGENGLDGTDLYSWLLSQVRQFGAQLVVVDTAAATFGGDENNRAQVTKYLNEILAHLATEIDGAVVLCAHPSKSSAYSGSTAWDASFRSRLNLSRYPIDDDDEQPDLELTSLRILEKQKANYSGIGDRLVLEWNDGCFRVQGQSEDTVDRIGRQARHRQVDQVFLTALDSLIAQNRNVSHAPHAANYAPKAMRRHSAAKGVSKAELTAAMERLLEQGTILANQTVGRRPNRTPLHGLARSQDEAK